LKYNFSGIERLWCAFDKTAYGLVHAIKTWRVLLRGQKFFIKTPDGPHYPDTVWTWDNGRLLFEVFDMLNSPNFVCPPAHSITVHSHPENLAAAFRCGRGIQPFNAVRSSNFDHQQNQQLSWNAANLLAASDDLRHRMYSYQPAAAWNADDPEEEPSNPDHDRWILHAQRDGQAQSNQTAAASATAPRSPTLDLASREILYADDVHHFQPTAASTASAAGTAEDFVQEPPATRQRLSTSDPSYYPAASAEATATRITARRYASFLLVHNDEAGHCSAVEAGIRLVNVHQAWNWAEMCLSLSDMIRLCPKCNPHPPSGPIT